MSKSVRCPLCGQTFEALSGAGEEPCTCPYCKQVFVGGIAAALPAEGAGWYVLLRGVQRLGPFSEQEVIGLIQKGKVIARDLVWSQGMRTWLPCSSIGNFCVHLPRES